MLRTDHEETVVGRVHVVLRLSVRDRHGFFDGTRGVEHEQHGVVEVTGSEVTELVHLDLHQERDLVAFLVGSLVVSHTVAAVSSEAGVQGVGSSN